MARIYFGDNMDEALCKQLSSRGVLPESGQIELIAIYDRSVFGRAKGIAFTDSLLIVFDEEAQEIRYDAVQHAQWQISEQWGLVSLTLQMLSGETWSHDLNLKSEELTRLVELLATRLPFVDETEKSLTIPPLVVKTAIPVSTTSSVGRRKIAALHGPVFGEAELSMSNYAEPCLRKDLLAEGRQRAIDQMAQAVNALGGAAVIGLRVDHISLGNSRLLITAVGTAVSLVESDGPYR